MFSLKMKNLLNKLDPFDINYTEFIRKVVPLLSNFEEQIKHCSNAYIECPYCHTSESITRKVYNQIKHSKYHYRHFHSFIRHLINNH